MFPSLYVEAFNKVNFIYMYVSLLAASQMQNCTNTMYSTPKQELQNR